MTTIVGVKISNRKENAVGVQKILTENGCNIKTRLGLNITEGDACSTSGLILLEIVDDNDAKKIIEELEKVENVTIQKMKF